MTAGDTRALVRQAVLAFGEEVPSLKSLKLPMRVELRARGDIAIWRVDLPEARVSKEPSGDARVTVSLPRSHFNELVKDGRLKHWVDAFERGQVNVSGDAAVMRLVGNVIERQLARAR